MCHLIPALVCLLSQKFLWLDETSKNKMKSIFNKNITVSKRLLSSYSLWKEPRNRELNVDYICNPKNIQTIQENISRRKGVGNIRLVNELSQKLNQMKPNSIWRATPATKTNQRYEAVHFSTQRIPRDNKKTEPGELVELEHALLNYFLKKLLQNGFELISVPDILPREVIESCGMNTRGERNQVYTIDSKLHEPDLCLSGTSEMALAYFLAGKTLIEEDLPKKLAAVSRCYRAETSSTAEEKGIFRVHEFTKVEMFVVTTPETSDAALEEIRSLQEEHFKPLGLHFQVLDMPPHELGAQAYRKYDMEAWMPGRKIYGEISSCSNCTDYQSRRLGIKYRTKTNTTEFVHTLNGTACAIPRLLIALTETGQDEKGFVHLPEVLHEYMGNKTVIGRQKKIPELRLVKNKK
ncbi:hypothetical protein JTB14_015851 [Gonioctena quinquepunctata]|nr:hypothetical protein JTB14_015851 [Gonioctena quinquepunctata]